MKQAFVKALVVGLGLAVPAAGYAKPAQKLDTAGEAKDAKKKDVKKDGKKKDEKKEKEGDKK